MNDHLTFIRGSLSSKNTVRLDPNRNSWVMEITAVFIRLRVAVTLFAITRVVFFGSFVNGLMKKIDPLVDQAGAELSVEASSLKCTLQGTPRLPAFSMDGDFVVGGVFFLHYKANTGIYNYTTKPEPTKCAGRLVTCRGGVFKRNWCRKKATCNLYT